MKEVYLHINELISSKLTFKKTKDLVVDLECNDKLRKEYMILLHSREYLIAKSALDEIENDSDQLTARNQVQIHFLNK